MELLLIPIQQWGDPLTLICDPPEAYDIKAKKTYKGWGFFLFLRSQQPLLGDVAMTLSTAHHFRLAVFCARVHNPIVSVMKNISHSKPSEKSLGVF